MRSAGRSFAPSTSTRDGAEPELSRRGGSLARTVAAHEAVLEALTARDGELAAERIAEHIGSAWAERRAGRYPARPTPARGALTQECHPRTPAVEALAGLRSSCPSTRRSVEG